MTLVYDAIEELGAYMQRGLAVRHGRCSAECVWLKLDEEDAGGLSVEFRDLSTGSPVGYMHPDDFRALWDEVASR